MSAINFQTECGCGAPLAGAIKKPTRYEATIVKLTCGDCDSRYMMKCERDLKAKFKRVFITNCYVLEISPALRRIISTDPIVRAKVMADKLGFKNKPDNSVIETEMDR